MPIGWFYRALSTEGIQLRQNPGGRILQPDQDSALVHAVESDTLPPLQSWARSAVHWRLKCARQVGREERKKTKNSASGAPHLAKTAVLT